MIIQTLKRWQQRRAASKPMRVIAVLQFATQLKEGHGLITPIVRANRITFMPYDFSLKYEVVTDNMPPLKIDDDASPEIIRAHLRVCQLFALYRRRWRPKPSTYEDNFNEVISYIGIDGRIQVGHPPEEYWTRIDINPVSGKRLQRKRGKQ